MLAETTTTPSYHQQFGHYSMSSVTSNVTNNHLYNNHHHHHHHTIYQSQQQTPQTSSTYGKEIEQLESLAIALCSQEIIEASQSLDISQDPLNWNSCDVRSWITWQVQHKNWPMVSLDNFIMNGMELCLLTEDDFIRRAPMCGASLFAQLDVWKLANLTLNAERMELVDMLLWSPNSSSSNSSSNNNSNSSDAVSGTSSHGPTCSPSHTALTSITNSLTCPSPVTASAVGTATAPTTTTTTPSTATSTSAAASVTTLTLTNNTGVNELSIYHDKIPLEVECMSPPTSLLSYGSPDSLPESPHTSSSSCDSPISDDGCGPLSPISNTSGSVPGTRAANHIHLWQFLKELLSSPQLYGSAIRWLDRSSGVFKIEDSVKVARLWGKRKNRPAMNYDKLSRSIRQYYKKGIMRKTERSQRLVYQFCHPYSL